ncbi:MAG: amino acid permease, partial [Bdellovibrionota bacterium]
MMKIASDSTRLERRLGPLDAGTLVVGTIIGTGIFLKTSTMAQHLGSMKMVMFAWILSGILSYAGALTYAELAARLPESGGEYAMLNHAYGQRFGHLLGFLFGWMRFWIGSPGSIAAYGVAVATFLTGLFHVDSIPGGRPLIAIFFIALFSAINCFQVRFGANVQNFLTFLKMILILGLALGAGLFGTTPDVALPSLTQTSTALSMESGISAFGMAMIAALWAFDGWNNLPMVGGEIRDPQKNIPIALGIGMLAVITLYLSVNWAYFHVLTVEQIQYAHSSAHREALPVATLA